MTTRRGFIGGLIAGGAGLVAGGIAGKKTGMGVPHDLVVRMSEREHSAWLHAHMEVNRSFGYDRKVYNETWTHPKRGDL